MAKILCVEVDVAVLESRCAALKTSGYAVASASPQLAEIVLRSQKFDLIVLSWLSDYDLQRIVNLADDADILALEGLTMPPKLLSLVAQRLNGPQRSAQQPPPAYHVRHIATTYVLSTASYGLS